MKAHLVGGGIASLAAAAHLIRDGGVPGPSITIYEASDRLGGALDAAGSPETGYIMRGGRMLEEKYLCTRDLLSFIPAFQDPGKTAKQDILDFYETTGWDNRARLIGADGEILEAERFGLCLRDHLNLAALWFRPERFLGYRRVREFFRPGFFQTNFWFMFSTIFAFTPWHSAIEMRRYLKRFVHLMPKMVTMSAVQRTRYNQFEAIVTPIRDWLAEQGVTFLLGARVMDLDLRKEEERISVARLWYMTEGRTRSVDVAEDDPVFVTNGSMVADSSIGSMTEAPEMVTSRRDGSWALWEALSGKRPVFGNPSVFNSHVEESAWESFTLTCKDPLFIDLVEQLSQREAGRGGLMTLTASNWLITFSLFHHPHYARQPEGVFVVWGYGLYVHRPGNYVQKPMRDCTGAEILSELLRHLKFDDHHDRIMETSICIPCLMPYAGSVFMARKTGDRPAVIPQGSGNLAFIGQFSDLPGDVVFTVEYSVRSAQTAVCGLLGLKKAPPPLYRGDHSPKVLLDALRALCH